MKGAAAKGVQSLITNPKSTLRIVVAEAGHQICLSPLFNFHGAVCVARSGDDGYCCRPVSNNSNIIQSDLVPKLNLYPLVACLAYQELGTASRDRRTAKRTLHRTCTCTYVVSFQPISTH